MRKFSGFLRDCSKRSCAYGLSDEEGSIRFCVAIRSGFFRSGVIRVLSQFFFITLRSLFMMMMKFLRVSLIVAL